MKPILFNTDMVRAIQNSTKTVTRRVVKPQPKDGFLPTWRENWDSVAGTQPAWVVLPPYRPGDILYVRETWCWCYCWDCGMDTKDGCVDETAEKFYNHQKAGWGCYGYRASFEENEVPFDGWHPSIHMPREAARIFLRVTNVRVERLQEMADEDLMRDFDFCWEAIQAVGRGALAKPFWDSTIKPANRALYGWGANPYVWVIEFERISREEALAHEV